jgi:hypothetical protein
MRIDPLRHRLALACVLAALVGAAPAAAQIVNVQSRFSELQEEGAKAAIEASADWRTGNLNLLVLGAQGSVQYGHGNSQVMGSVRGEVTLADGIDDGRRTFEHLRYRYWLSERWAAETFVQHEFDPQRRLRLRFLAGAGPRWVPLHGELGALSVGLAVMGERTELSAGEADDAGRVHDVLRASSYVIGRLEVSETVTLSQSFYFQPRFDRPSDYRLLSETGIVVPLTENLALSLSFVAAMQSRPPEGVAPLDTRLLNRLAVTF